jgi:hypothetical protein
MKHPNFPKGPLIARLLKRPRLARLPKRPQLVWRYQRRGLILLQWIPLPRRIDRLPTPSYIIRGVLRPSELASRWRLLALGMSLPLNHRLPCWPADTLRVFYWAMGTDQSALRRWRLGRALHFNILGYLNVMPSPEALSCNSSSALRTSQLIDDQKIQTTMAQGVKSVLHLLSGLIHVIANSTSSKLWVLY